MAFLNPFIEIFFSIVLGCAVGFALTYFNKLSKQKENAMNLVIAAIFLVIGLADLLDLSNLLACTSSRGCNRTYNDSPRSIAKLWSINKSYNTSRYGYI